MKEILTRITSESPTFFKKIMALGITLGAIGAAIMAIPTSVVDLPQFVDDMAGYFIAIGVVAASIAKTTVSDSNVLPKKGENIIDSK